jgi:hypothetical protein
MPFHSVAIYLTDRRYGGPEEGGWWYDVGERVDDVLDGMPPDSVAKVFSGEASEEEAEQHAALLNGLLGQSVNVGRRSIDSVLSTGRYVAEVRECWPEKNYPKEKPHYE